VNDATDNPYSKNMRIVGKTQPVPINWSRPTESLNMTRRRKKKKPH